MNEPQTTDENHLTQHQLEAALDEIRRAPKDHGVLGLIVRLRGLNAKVVRLGASGRR